MEQASFGSIKLLTHDTSLPFAVKITPLNGLGAYSDFCIRELHKHVDTSHAMVAQWDGYMTRGESWTDDFLKYDFIGSPWQPTNVVGNGGWSLRSKKLLELCAKFAAAETNPCHPEDAWICMHHRKNFENAGMKFAPLVVARRWGFEGRSFDSVEWRGTPNIYKNECGFHSWLSKLPPSIDKPNIYHSSGDYGDLVYGLSVVAATGGGVIFMSGDNHYPYPLNSRWGRTGAAADWVDNIRPLLEAQPYVWKAQYTHGTPHSTTHDLNAFRRFWKPDMNGNLPEGAFDSIFQLHQRAFGTQWPEDSPWLTVPDPIVTDRPIIVNRTSRYDNDKFDWHGLVQKWGHKMLFVGTEQEAQVFEGFSPPHPPVTYRKTNDMLELARIISGGKCFIGNQSASLAIAHGLGKPCIVQEWGLNPNCRLKRPNTLYGIDHTPELPESWLK